VASPGTIEMDLDLASHRVPLDQAIPCGLLVNEMLSNTLKHGFPEGRSGAIRIELKVVGDGRDLSLRISDTGVGLPADFDRKRNESLGLQLVSDLTRQLGGVLAVGPGPGASFAVTFPSPLSVPS
jgi:two-component sensor histidine kinase